MRAECALDAALAAAALLCALGQGRPWGCRSAILQVCLAVACLENIVLTLCYGLRLGLSCDARELALLLRDAHCARC
jgi:hypothetical protein